MDILILVSEVHAELDTESKPFKRAENTGLAEILADNRLIGAGRLDLLAQILCRTRLELGAVEEKSE